MNKKIFNIFAILRIIFYIFLFGAFIIIPKEYFINHPASCFIRDHYGFLCPCCGVTRCFSCLMHFDFVMAIKYNIVFAIGIFPICLIIFCNDIINVLIRLFSKKQKYSIIERFIFNV